MTSKILLLACLLLGVQFAGLAQSVALTSHDFDAINLQYPGLEKVNKLVDGGKYPAAAAELLAYFQKKNAAKPLDVSNLETAIEADKPLSAADLEAANNALEHRFKPQKGYGYFDYGKDINWQYWPVKDDEVRWQLHRVRWWLTMALAYRQTKNEAYATEWRLQFEDWMKKNRLGLSADNDRFAWRPLEVSDRVQSLGPIFSIFVQSKTVTPEFLLLFLKNYAQHADYLPANYADAGNHRLFEAQRTLFAGVFFPELKHAPDWRKSGITVLNAEIQKQVYPDGMQWELSPIYHAASIDIFLKAYRTARSGGLANEFPDSYARTVEKMVMAFINISFPDYQQPMFGDSWLADKRGRLKVFQSWAEQFPQNPHIQYFASDGQAGSKPNWLSRELGTAGFYTFRNGWTPAATVMVLKASPPGEFHAQPDNGTFELWVRGRNFTPDAGSYVYGGDAAVMKQRNWYRQTRVHSTMTLNDSNMVITKARQHKWQTGNELDVLSYTNPSYPALNHRRSVLFVEHRYFLIIDEAQGLATGKLGVHYQLKEDSNPAFNNQQNTVVTQYADKNNLLISCLNSDKVGLKPEEGKVSYQYKKEVQRPAFAFEKPKTDGRTQRFVTVVYPFEGTTAPTIRLKENAGNDYAKGIVNLTLIIDGKPKEIKTTLN